MIQIPSHLLSLFWFLFYLCLGALGDFIDGNEGQDIILGDFGLYDANVEFLIYQHFESYIDYSEFAGPDTIDGGADDDILMGQEFDDVIEGGTGNDDIYGGKFLRGCFLFFCDWRTCSTSECRT